MKPKTEEEKNILDIYSDGYDKGKIQERERIKEKIDKLESILQQIHDLHKNDKQFEVECYLHKKFIEELQELKKEIDKNG